MTKPVLDAATIVLVRDSDRGPELFLSKRTPRAAFMPNLFVYPGGRVDAADASPALLSRVEDLQRVCFEDDASEVRRDANVVACLRECFEEAGVLFLAPGVASPSAADRRAARLESQASPGSFQAFLERCDLRLSARTLVYFSHWITPTFESRRFDTRFFLAPMPPSEDATADESEMLDGQWKTAAEALSAFDAGTLALAPPTWATLREFSGLGSVDALVAWANAQKPWPILPELRTIDDEPVLVMPGDPLYPCPWPTRGPWRVATRDGRWVPIG